jgi:hypothetical protein
VCSERGRVFEVILALLFIISCDICTVVCSECVVDIIYVVLVTIMSSVKWSSSSLVWLYIFVCNIYSEVCSKGFWQWCVTLITIAFLDFVHRPEFYIQWSLLWFCSVFKNVKISFHPQWIQKFALLSIYVVFRKNCCL